MNVVAADVEVCGAADAVVGEASLPDGEFGGETMREASFDNSDVALESRLWREEEMDVVGHDDEGVKLVVAFPPQFGSVVLEGFDEKFGRALDLKEAAAVVSSAGDEESSGARCSAGDRHTAIVTACTSGAKAPGLERGRHG
jgi:hypothetical protein